MRILSVFFVLSFILIGSAGFAQKADAILGTWSTENDKSTVEIFKKGNRYFAKIVALKNPLDENGKPKLDTKNPDSKKKQFPIVGLTILENLEYISGSTWDDGTIYDPESGNEYSCKINLVNQNQIEMRGYMGFSILGRSTTWTRKK